MHKEQKEIELAINQYLCDTITYDFDALDNAEGNNFMYVDESFNDSFTAYGALINGKMGDDIDLYGYYWLGVIYLITEGF